MPNKIKETGELIRNADENMKKNQVVRFRVTQLEKEVIELKASKLGLTVSDYLRVLVKLN